MSALCICCASATLPQAEAWRQKLAVALPANAISVVVWRSLPEGADAWPVEGYVLWLASGAEQEALPTFADWLPELDRRRSVLLVAIPPARSRPDGLVQHSLIPWPVGAAEPDLLPFLRRELEPVLAAPQLRSADPQPLPALTRRELRLAATRCLPEDAILGFFFDQRLDPDQIGGGNQQERLLRFLHYIDRRDLMAAFADFLADEYGGCIERTLRSLKSQPAWQVWF